MAGAERLRVFDWSSDRSTLMQSCRVERSSSTQPQPCAQVNGTVRVSTHTRHIVSVELMGAFRSGFSV